MNGDNAPGKGPANTGDPLATFIGALDHSPDGYGLYAPDNRLIACNETWRRLAEPLAHLHRPGTSFKSFIYAAAERGLLPQARGREKARTDELIERIGDRADGAQMRYGERWLEVRRTPLPDGRTIVDARDVTRRSEREALLKVVTDTLPTLLCYVDRAGDIRYANATCVQWFGDPPGGLVGRKVREFFHGRDARELDALRGQVLEGEQVRFELRLRYGDGVARDVEGIFAPHRGEDGELRGHVALVQDVTVRAELGRQLQQLQRMDAVGQLTGGIAHDFNNLLTVVLGNLRLLEKITPAPAPGRAQLDAAVRASLRGAELVRRLLAFSRRQVLDPAVVDPRELLEGTRALLDRTLPATIGVTVRASDTAWPVRVDAAQLESALLNLVLNAHDAMSAGGRITLAASNLTLEARALQRLPGLPAGDYQRVSVSDPGHGMPPEVLERAYEPFFTTKDQAGGSGLGLSMVYGFVRQSGGDIDIESAPGRGTTVHLYLPRWKGEDPSVSATAPAGRGLPRGSETLLVVEDDADVRCVVVALLGELGYRVLEAPDGRRALQVLGANPDIALLFTDVVMPGGINGFELGRLAKRQWPGLKVLYTSGYAGSAMPQSEAQAAPQGVDLLRKPYGDEALARRLRRILDPGSP